MTMNEDVHKMRVQILNLRAAMMTFSTALCRFPACGTPMGCNLRCSEAGNVMRQLHEDMDDLLISARMVLSAVFSPQPEVWDTFWCFAENESCPERTLAQLGKNVISDHEEYITFYGQIDDEMFDELGKGFSKHEWTVLSAKEAWQSGHRLSQILYLAEYLETQMEKKFDLLLLMVSNCEVGKKAELRSSLTA
jgi:hypothetical protein